MMREVAASIARAFNRSFPVGTEAILVHDLGEWHRVWTCGEAYVLQGVGDEATPMIRIETRDAAKPFPRGAWLLERIVPVNPATFDAAEQFVQNREV